jgi:hypothetical protein
LSLTYQTKRWFKGFSREIVIKIPITCLDSAVSFGHVEVIGSEKLWYIRMENNALHFSLAFSVNLMIDMQLGVETMRVENRFSLEINQLVGWRKTIGLNKASVYGTCHIDFNRTCSAALYRSDQIINNYE